MKVSIIVPIYNVEKYILKCLDSIHKQTYENLEIILVNDGSTDSSKDIIEKFSEKDDRVIIINKVNGGLSSARNAGIEQASGEYIMHVDGDDYLEFDAVELLVSSAVKYNSDIVIGDINIVFKDSKADWIDSTLADNTPITGKEFLENYYFLGKAKNSIWNKLIRRTLYVSNEIYHPNKISLGEDSATLPRLLLHCNKVTKINRSIYNYRQNLSGMTRASNKKILQYQKAIEIVEQHFIKYNEAELFNKYRSNFMFNVFYYEVLLIPYLDAKKKDYTDYIIGWELFLKEVHSIKSNSLIMNNISKKQKLKIYAYSAHFVIGDTIQYLNNFYKLIFNFKTKAQ